MPRIITASGLGGRFRILCQVTIIGLLQQIGAAAGSLRPNFSTTMTPVYSCPIHGSCASANGVRRYDITPGCSLYATPPYNGPRRAGVPRRHPTYTGCRRGDRCRTRHTASSSSITGSSTCLAASRRQADSVDALLPSVTTLDVVAGPNLAATNPGLRSPADYMDEKADTDGVFYTANSQHPQACGHVTDLLFSTSWAREHFDSDLPTNDSQTAVHADDRSGQQQLTLSDAASVGSDRGQATLLVDFRC